MKRQPVTTVRWLHAINLELIASINAIVANWETGDLSAAVNAARKAANRAKRLIGDTSPNETFDKLVQSGQALLTAYARGELNQQTAWEDVDLAHELTASAFDELYGRQPGASIDLANALAKHNEHEGDNA